MKLSLLVVAGLLAPSLEAFTVPSRSATSSIKSFTKLAFVPKNDVSTTEPTSTFADGKLNTAPLSPLDLAKKDQTVWDKFANWITSTENRLYIGWFGALMFPLSLPPRPASLLRLLQPLLVSDLNLPCHQSLCQFFSRMIVFSQSTLTASRPVAGSLLYGNNIISGAVVPSPNAIGMFLFLHLGSYLRR